MRILLQSIMKRFSLDLGNVKIGIHCKLRSINWYWIAKRNIVTEKKQESNYQQQQQNHKNFVCFTEHSGCKEGLSIEASFHFNRHHGRLYIQLYSYMYVVAKTFLLCICCKWSSFGVLVYDEFVALPLQCDFFSHQHNLLNAWLIPLYQTTDERRMP